MRIAKRENLGKGKQKNSGRFMERGVVLDKCSRNSYLVKKSDGRIVKNKSCDIKAIEVIRETPS